jgi:hypothetical protein
VTETRPWMSHGAGIFSLFGIAPLALLLGPTACYAEAGELGGVAVLAAWVLGAIWLVLAGLLYLGLRWLKLSSAKRAAIALFAFAAPFLLLGGATGVGFLIGGLGMQTTGNSSVPVTIAGVTFPAGSRVLYEQTAARGFWNRRPVSVLYSAVPATIGLVKITGLKTSDDGSPFEVSVQLNEDQNINGWLCRQGINEWMDLSLTPAGPLLRSCWLAGARKIGAVSWPEGANVFRNNYGDWVLGWTGEGAAAGVTTTAFGFRVERMDALYGSDIGLKEWTGTSYEQTEVGDRRYIFDSPVSFTWERGDRILVTGSGRDTKTGDAIQCVGVNPSAKRVDACTKSEVLAVSKD